MRNIEAPIGVFDFSDVSLDKSRDTKYYKPLIGGDTASFTLDAQAEAWLYTNNGIVTQNAYNKSVRPKTDLTTVHASAAADGNKYRIAFILSNDNPCHRDIIHALVGADGKSGAIADFRRGLAKYLAESRANTDIAEYIANQFPAVDANNYDRLVSLFEDELVSYIVKPTKDGLKTVINAVVWSHTPFYDVRALKASKYVGDDWDPDAVIPLTQLMHTSFEAVPVLRLGGFEFNTRRSNQAYRLNISLEVCMAIVRPVVRNSSVGHELLKNQLDKLSISDDAPKHEDDEPLMKLRVKPSA